MSNPSFVSALADTKAPDLFSIQHVHLTGIKGVAMTALAQCLVDKGIIVTGSDVQEDFVTAKILSNLAIPLSVGFLASSVPDTTQLLVYTGAHQGQNNLQVLEAKRRQIPVLSHAEALGLLMGHKKGISVCGTGGKSTTSAMLSWILEFANMQPSYSVGVGNIPNLGRSGHYVKETEWFVTEADEYAVDPTCDHRPRFIFQKPTVAICTSLSYDHPDIYKTFGDMKKTFSDFFLQSENLYINGDSPALLELFTTLRNTDAISFEACSVGFNPLVDYQLSDFKTLNGKTQTRVKYIGPAERQPFLNQKEWLITLKVPGKHNAINAVLAMLAAYEANVSFEQSIRALAEFVGTMRRFEFKGTYSQMHCYDDYAHTPEEILATLTALREWEPNKKIVVAFQPHTYSRTRALFEEFAQALSSVDTLILLDIFASAREQTDSSVSSSTLAKRIQELKPSLDISIVPTIDALMVYPPLFAGSKENVFITMGAGDIYKVFEKLLMDKSL